MNRDDTIDLLTAVAARDQRTVGQGDVAAWSVDLADVTLVEALDAVSAFHQSERALERRVQAADIVQWAKWSRRKAVERDHTARELGRVREPQRALPPGGALVGSDPTAGRGESASLRELWDEVMPFDCQQKPKGCGQPAGQRCINPHTLTWTKIPHPIRLLDAGI
jgi:hypothetical protein